MNRLACAARHRTASRRHNDDVRDPYGTWSWRSPGFRHGASKSRDAESATPSSDPAKTIWSGSTARMAQDGIPGSRASVARLCENPKGRRPPQDMLKACLPRVPLPSVSATSPPHRDRLVARSREWKDRVAFPYYRMVGRLRDMRRVSSHCQPNPPKHERCCLAAERRTGCGRMKG
jgi:hypothetical protein